jgi:thiamine biosynthesis protein ThiS
MRLKVNGEPYETRPGITLAELIEELRLGETRIAVALNGAVEPRAGHRGVELAENDIVEVIHAVAGG